MNGLVVLILLCLIVMFIKLFVDRNWLGLILFLFTVILIFGIS